jgi:hypothetical protein
MPMRHYIRVTAGPYAGQIYQFDTKKDAIVLERSLNQLRPYSTDYGNDRDGFPETHLKGHAHATIAGTPGGSKRSPKTRLIHVVQGNYGYGHGWEDLTAEDTRKEALARLREYRENESAPFRLIRRRERIGSPAGSAHARKKKLDPREAKQLIQSDGIDFKRDFHELSSHEVERVLEVAKLAGYRKRRDAPGSTARMYFQYLSRLS